MFNVLIVEDLPSDAGLCEREVKKVLSPCKFVRVDTREDFLKALTDFQPDLILCDYSLPHFDGMTALKLAQQYNPDMPFILVTGSVSEDIAVECMKAGAWNYIIKGHIKRLGPAVLAALDEKQQRIDRRYMAEKLRESEERYRAIVENTADGIILQEASGKIVTWNRTAERVFGISPHDAICHTSTDRDWQTIREDGSPFPGEEHPSMTTLATGKPCRNVIMGVNNNSGNLSWVNINTQPLFKRGENQPYAVVISFSDVTEIRQAEEQIRILGRLIDSSRASITVHDFNGNFLYFNKATLDLHGYTREEFGALSLRELDSPDSAELIAERMRQVQETGYASFEVCHRRKDGTAFPLLISAQMAVWRGQNVILSIATDLTERKEAEEALAMETARWRILIEQSRDGIVILDKEGAVCETNKRFADMLGYSNEEVRRLRVWDWEYLVPRESLMNMLNDVDEKGDHFETKHRRRDGSIYDVEISTNAALFGRQKLIFCVCRDITERKQTEEQIARSKMLLQTVIDSTPDRIAVKNEAHRYLLVNRSLASALDCQPQDMIGKLDSEFFSEEQLNGNAEKGIRSTRVDEATAFSGEIVHGISRTGNEPGGSFIFDSYRVPLKASNGSIYGVLVYNRDITELYTAYEALRRSYQETQKVLSEIVDAISTICENRDPYTAGHQGRVSKLACAIASKLSIDGNALANIKTGTILHDIGKLYVPAEILSKPGKLSTIEFEIIKSHPQVGYEIIQKIEFPEIVGNIILQHHERLDGSGYPHHLKAGEIAFEAKIAAVADVVEAMSSHRPYRPAIGIEKAIEEIRSNKGILYDDSVVDACIDILCRPGFSFE